MRKVYLSIVIMLALVLAGNHQLSAQEDNQTSNCPVQLDFSAILKSRHVWNGILSCNAWNIQPSITLSAYGFSLNAWALTSLSKDWHSEIDFTLSYAYGPFSISYIDMWYNDDGVKFNHLFRYKKEDDGNLHQQYAFIAFEGVPKFPISLECGVFTFGDYSHKALKDAAGNPILGEDGDPLTVPDKSQWSMYLQMGYSHTISTGQTLEYAIGGTPYKGFFSNQANIVNLKFVVGQPVKVTDYFGLNLKGELVINPYRESVFLTFSVGML